MTNKLVLPDKCPICGGKMEKGYLRCKTPVWGWGWVKERKPQGDYTFDRYYQVVNLDSLRRCVLDCMHGKQTPSFLVVATSKNH